MTLTSDDFEVVWTEETDWGDYVGYVKCKSGHPTTWTIAIDDSPLPSKLKVSWGSGWCDKFITASYGKDLKKIVENDPSIVLYAIRAEHARSNRISRRIHIKPDYTEQLWWCLECEHLTTWEHGESGGLQKNRKGELYHQKYSTYFCKSCGCEDNYNRRNIYAK